jgi:hypothetical protein
VQLRGLAAAGGVRQGGRLAVWLLLLLLLLTSRQGPQSSNNTLDLRSTRVHDQAMLSD